MLQRLQPFGRAPRERLGARAIRRLGLQHERQRRDQEKNAHLLTYRHAKVSQQHGGLSMTSASWGTLVARSEPMRVLAVDVGGRRIGLAISDPSRTLARPLTTLEVGNAADGVARVADEIGRLERDDDGLASIVVGLPVRLDGTPSDETARVAAFIDALEAKTTLPIVTADERLTSHEAESRLASGSATGASARRSSTRRRRPSSCRTISISRTVDRTYCVKRLLALLFAARSCRRGGGPLGVCRRDTAVSRLQRGRAVRGYPARHRHARHRRSPRRSRRRPRSADVPCGAVAQRARDAAQGGGVPVRRCGRRRARSSTRLARGDVFVVPVTFPEGLTIAEMVEDRSRPRGSDPPRPSLMPRGTPRSSRDRPGRAGSRRVSVSRDVPAVAACRRGAVSCGSWSTRFDRALTPDLRAAAAARGLSVRQVVTLASIVEKETASPDERPLVASVYENRLRIGMALQCDPTVIYALERVGRYHGNLHHDDLSFDSPYNTYRYPGLPPGPIAAPGRASLEAVLHPADVVLPVFREPQRRLARVRGVARRAQPQRAEIPGGIFQGTTGRQVEIMIRCPASGRTALSDIILDA